MESFGGKILLELKKCGYREDGIVIDLWTHFFVIAGFCISAFIALVVCYVTGEFIDPFYWGIFCFFLILDIAILSFLYRKFRNEKGNITN